MHLPHSPLVTRLAALCLGALLLCSIVAATASAETVYPAEPEWAPDQTETTTDIVTDVTPGEEWDDTCACWLPRPQNEDPPHWDQDDGSWPAGHGPGYYVQVCYGGGAPAGALSTTGAFAAYVQSCPASGAARSGVVLRNSGSTTAFNTPASTGAFLDFHAPTGLTFDGIYWVGKMWTAGPSGCSYSAGISDGGTWISGRRGGRTTQCAWAHNSWDSASGAWGEYVPLASRSHFRFEASCAATVFACNTQHVSTGLGTAAEVQVWAADIRINDGALPTLEAVELPGLDTNTWIGAGSKRVRLQASDASGIRSSRVYLDGTLVQKQDYTCDYRRLRPCTDQEVTYTFDAGALTEGAHVITFAADDAAFNYEQQDLTFSIDRQAPAAPLTVSDVTATDTDLVAAPYRPAGVWSAAPDARSGVASYQTCVKAGAAPISAGCWSTSGAGLQATATADATAGAVSYFCVRAVDVVGNVSTAKCSDGALPVAINDGPLGDRDWTSSRSQATANWTNALLSDGVTRLGLSAQYQTCVALAVAASGCSGTILAPWGAVSTTPTATISLATLAAGVKYHVCVSVTVWTTGTPTPTTPGVVTCSDGVTTDYTAPAPVALVNDGAGADIDAISGLTTPQTIGANWPLVVGAGADAVPATGYMACISTSPSCATGVVSGLSRTGVSTSGMQGRLARTATLQAGPRYFVCVVSMDEAGNRAAPRCSDGFVLGA